MVAQPTKMALEVREIPDALQRLHDNSQTSIVATADAMRQTDPCVIATIARGSSDHAATYLKYAFELQAGIPVASIGPSVASIYKAELKMARTATIAISQSGKSPDIVQMAESAKRSGTLSIAMTNTPNSDLAEACDHPINIQAGPELSVAATKTFVSSIAAGLMLLAHWTRDKALLEALEKLPAQAAAAVDCDWTVLCDRLCNEPSLYVLGRGPSFAIAHEVALKFKETCQIHAEAYSSAEVMHGPVSIVGSGFPILGLAARDAAEKPLLDVCEKLAQQGAHPFVTSTLAQHATRLPAVATGHPLTDPLMLIISFYAFIEQLARKRGLNPDVPPNLRKVTETV